MDDPKNKRKCVITCGECRKEIKADSKGECTCPERDTEGKWDKDIKEQ